MRAGTSISIIHRAPDAGINFIDTADVYSQGESEVILGKALDILDRIDEIVPPGVTINRADAGYAPPALTIPSLRRRPSA